LPINKFIQYVGNLKEIPHPFVDESITFIQQLNIDNDYRCKVYFTHLNHSNPLLDCESEEFKSTMKQNFEILQQEMKFNL
jgi:pyrroloquinoline quinone biosynthesis protein B